ncbi:S8 family serine peptidase [Sphaerospermopsis aphanizomenoides BCCUSP55]|uniref:S8 family serine peptidase n=1 Tax=Sphaerospermopsis aphanizomenoides TaxID=459663 RepID=UPI001906F578|nr:S8 family serine peptidase [Sphaerospermopsis aphanizomenoides]MBK1988582.1 S8 family serine peptidase [Sphaerospermopsis aphanizomenoides BCCUSP55]
MNTPKSDTKGNIKLYDLESLLQPEDVVARNARNFDNLSINNSSLDNNQNNSVFLGINWEGANFSDHKSDSTSANENSLSLKSIVGYVESIKENYTEQKLNDLKSYIVVFNKNVVNVNAEALRVASGIGGNITHIYESVLKGFAVEIPEAAIAALRNNPNIAYIEEDRPVSLIDGFDSSSQTVNNSISATSTQQTPWGIDRVNGGINASNISNVYAFVLDTGIDLQHTDLNIDTTYGFNAFKRGQDSRTLDDLNGHGTHVAGTIGAVDNSFGVIGVAAGATVVPIKVLNSNGSGRYSGIIAGINHVKNVVNTLNSDADPNNDIKGVANLSLGGSYSKALNDALIGAAGDNLKFVVAAGNESVYAGNTSPASASQNQDDIYAIAAFNSSDAWASFSNYGLPGDLVDYAQPGVNILSTWNDGGYKTISGTSMASPHFAGLQFLELAGLTSITTDGSILRTGTSELYTVAVSTVI